MDINNAGAEDDLTNILFTEVFCKLCDLSCLLARFQHLSLYPSPMCVTKAKWSFQMRKSSSRAERENQKSTVSSKRFQQVPQTSAKPFLLGWEKVLIVGWTLLLEQEKVRRYRVCQLAKFALQIRKIFFLDLSAAFPVTCFEQIYHSWKGQVLKFTFFPLEGVRAPWGELRWMEISAAEVARGQNMKIFYILQNYHKGLEGPSELTGRRKMNRDFLLHRLLRASIYERSSRKG